MRARNIAGKEYGLIKLLLSKDHKPGSKYARVAKSVKRSPETVRVIALTSSFREFEAKKAAKVAIITLMRQEKQLAHEVAQHIRLKRDESKRLQLIIALLVFAALVVFLFIR